jgi:hypothetical protein
MRAANVKRGGDRSIRSGAGACSLHVHRVRHNGQRSSGTQMAGCGPEPCWRARPRNAKLIKPLPLSRFGRFLSPSRRHGLLSRVLRVE